MSTTSKKFKQTGGNFPLGSIDSNKRKTKSALAICIKDQAECGSVVQSAIIIAHALKR
jgi:hypothetical protein